MRGDFQKGIELKKKKKKKKRERERIKQKRKKRGSSEGEGMKITGSVLPSLTEREWVR